MPKKFLLFSLLVTLAGSLLAAPPATYIPRAIKELDDARGVTLSLKMVPRWDGTKFTPSALTEADVTSLSTDLSTLTSAVSGKQSLDSDLTAVAALATDSFGLQLLTKSDAASIRTYIGAGSSAFDGAYSSLSGIPANITTWAGIAPAANVGTFLATPSGANLASALTSALPASAGGTGRTSLGTNIATALGTNIGGVAFVSATFAHQFTGTTAPRTITIPNSNFTVARTDASNTFTGTQGMTLADNTMIGGIRIGSSATTGSAPFIRTDGTNIHFNSIDFSNAIFLQRDTQGPICIQGNVRIGSGIVSGWSSAVDPSAAVNDTGLARASAGVLEVNNGTAGTLRDLSARNVTASTNITIGGGSAITSSGPGGALASGAFAASPLIGKAIITDATADPIITGTYTGIISDVTRPHGSGTEYAIAFSTAEADANYVPVISINAGASGTAYTYIVSGKGDTGFRLDVFDASDATQVDAPALDIAILR